MTGNPSGTEIDRMSVKIRHLDHLLNLTGEIIITSSNISILQRHLRDQAANLDKESMEMVNNSALAADRISGELHKLVMDIRLIPIKETFYRFRRVVRDLARKKGRQINFEIVGEDTLMDKAIAEKLHEVLAHQIRNAVDHGIEDPIQRKQLGKDPVGQLVLSASKKENLNLITVRDDGRGLDPEVIKRTAVRKGLLSQAAADSLSKEECFNLILEPGFSTASEATEISGRGVGMDVVKNVIEELGGEIIIESEPNRGTQFTYRIPQLSAVNITDALVVRAGKVYFAVPIGNVIATLGLSPGDVHTTMQEAESILYLGSIIPIYDLLTLLSGDTQTWEDDVIPVIIIEAKNGRIALKINEFIRPQKLVLMPLPEMFTIQGISGSTILGGNQVGLIINPVELIDRAVQDPNKVERPVEKALFEELSLLSQADSPLPEVHEEPTSDLESSPEPVPEENAPEASFSEEFIREILEILLELNEKVFQLEKDPENESHVNTIFRFFHTIKGNLMMTGQSELGDLVHQVESILDRIRDKEIEVNEDIIDIQLDTIETLDKSLNELKEGRPAKPPNPELLTMLEQYQRDEAMAQVGEDEIYNETFQLAPLSRLLLHTKTAQGANIFQSMIRFQPKHQDPFLVAYLILKRLALLGDVIDTVPALENIEQGMILDSMKVLFASTHNQEAVDRFMDKQLVKYYDVVSFDNLLME